MFYIHTWDFKSGAFAPWPWNEVGQLLGGEFKKICVLFSLMSLISKEVHDLTNFRGPDEKARLVSSQVRCVCNMGSKEMNYWDAPCSKKLADGPIILSLEEKKENVVLTCAHEL